MKRLLLCAVALAASVSAASAQECDPAGDVFCPGEDEVGAVFGEGGSISVFRAYPTDPITPWVSILPRRGIPTDPLLPPNPVLVNPGRFSQ